METKYYLDKFKKSADQLDPRLLSKTQIEYKTGIWLQSVVLKMQKKSWLNASPTAKPFEESIFFSIWVNDGSIQKNRLNYNIHALKLRQLKDYSIQSREFAEAFRSRFRPYQKKWPNISLDFGPLTLMEGWVRLDIENLESEIINLAHQFLEIGFIIDELLEERNKKNTS